MSRDPQVDKLLAQFWELPLTDIEEMTTEDRDDLMDKMAEERVKDLERTAIARRLREL
jgi:hypothetical protein